MNKMLFDGYTIYISEQNSQLHGLGLKNLGKDGMDLKELSEEEIALFSEKYPGICKQLEESCTLQIYRTPTYTYEASVGRITREGPYGEIDAFYATKSCSSLIPTEALLGIEESINLVKEKKAKVFERRHTLQKLYRPYGCDKYE